MIKLHQTNEAYITYHLQLNQVQFILAWSPVAALFVQFKMLAKMSTKRRGLGYKNTMIVT